MKRIDLHIHTHASDGHLAPGAVVRAADAAGMDLIAITDHDTAAGVPEALEAAGGLNVRVIPGIEISTSHGAAEIHVLGYFVDAASEPVQRHQRGSVLRREDRMRRMVGRLQEQGIPIEFDAVVAAAGPEAASIGRPHLARALLAAGHTRYYGEAFDLYLRDGGSAFVSTEFPSVREAIDTIHGAGGLAVWAHPPLDLFDAEIRGFAELGLDGVECYRPNTPPADAFLFETAARTLGLLTTGGSDWHGPHRSKLGDFTVRPHDIREFLEAAEARLDRRPLVIHGDGATG
ncbi:MAG TPA: PHP domain-containing protein [Longimicrobiaceae bacterium]|jgi:predicted metal-dependent phosphoesterase TrpH|nr:PHP domain-containing protein [Longimicrobiaceae bacterium]